MSVRTAVLGLAILVLLSTPAARAEGELQRLITPADARRLNGYEAVRAEALAEARSGGSKADLRMLDQALEGELMTVHGGFDAAGQWRCRMIKAGGLLPIVVYGWFRCRITDTGAGWRFEKITGSQRTSGRLYDESDTRMIYLGAGHYDREKPRPYASNPEQDQVAYVVRPGRNRLRFEFPSPKFESKLDILELRR